MAQAKSARIVAADTVAGARLLELELSEPLGFVGGQYLIVNSGVVLPSGKLAKRAYSILSADSAQERVQLAVQRIEGGPGSGFLHDCAIGDRFEFSGPWGKYLPDDSRPRPTLVIATDTGITAALGLVRGRQFAPQRPTTRLLWLFDSTDSFLPESMIRDIVVEAGVMLQLASILPIGHPERAESAQSAVARLVEVGRPESVFLSGDGALLYRLRALLGVENCRLECFFNNPEKKSL